MTTAGPKCPVCSKPAEAAFRPFCSRTCADVDLLRWLRGGYAIPGGLSDEDGDTDPLAEAQPETSPPHGKSHVPPRRREQ